MDNVKNNTYYIMKMLKDIKFIIEKTAGITLNELEANEVLCDCLCYSDVSHLYSEKLDLVYDNETEI